jgi:hypothetical protein
MVITNDVSRTLKVWGAAHSHFNCMSVGHVNLSPTMAHALARVYALASVGVVGSTLVVVISALVL